MRSAHGAARDAGRLTASECPPFDEMRPATSALPVRADRDASGRFVPGNRAGAAKIVKAGKRGALYELERKGDDAARAARAFGRRYAAHRRAELAKAFGEISAGVSSMIESAGELLASARYWSARSVADADPNHARLAAQLVAGARQAERDAWALADLESKSRAPQATAEWWRRFMQGDQGADREQRADESSDESDDESPDSSESTDE